MTFKVEPMDSSDEIKDFLKKETHFLIECRYDQIVEAEHYWSYTLSYLSHNSDQAIEFEIDFRELDVFVLITNLENHKLPQGYYTSNGRRVRMHLEHYLQHRNICIRETQKIIDLRKTFQGDLSQKIHVLIKAYCEILRKNINLI